MLTVSPAVVSLVLPDMVTVLLSPALSSRTYGSPGLVIWDCVNAGAAMAGAAGMRATISPSVAPNRRAVVRCKCTPLEVERWWWWCREGVRGKVDQPFPCHSPPSSGNCARDTPSVAGWIAAKLRKGDVWGP